MRYMEAVSIQGLTCKFGDFTAVDHIDLEVQQGEIFGFIGPNGAGKTTTIRMLTTLLKPTEGNGTIMGQDLVRNPKKVREHIALVPQAMYAVDWFLTVEENIMMYMKFYGMRDNKFIKKCAEQVMEDFGLTEARKKQVFMLSGGTQRRVAVARAFACQKPIVFLDEPTVGLDPLARRKTWEYIQKENAERNVTIFLTSHNMQEIEALCDRIALIKDGKILIVDQPGKITALTGEKAVVISYSGNDAAFDELPAFEEIKILNREAGKVTIGTNSVAKVIAELPQLQNQGVVITSINVTEPSLEDVFLKLVEGDVKQC